MELKIQKMTISHLKDALKIYNYFIENSFSNFEEKKISMINFKNNWKKITSYNLPYLVAIYNNKVVGIAYLNYFREKSGYKYTFENTIYIDINYHKKGFGNQLLRKLISESKKNSNIKKIIAVIGGINSKGSVKIHLKNNFKKIGIMKKIGYKNNQWIDAILMQKNI